MERFYSRTEHYFLALASFPIRLINRSLTVECQGCSHWSTSAFQSKAATELAENRRKIDALLDWVTSVGSSERQPQTSLLGMEQLSGASLETRALDATDGYVEGNQVPEKLDRQYELMKVRTLACL